MALFDFFKPKWKSKNSEVRLGAVQAMGRAELATLKTLAGTDEDVRVRLAAVERIGDRQALEELAGTSLSPEVLQAVRSKIGLLLFQAVLDGTDRTAAEPALERIEDPSLLERLATEAPTPALRVKAVERIGNPQALCRILEKNCGKEPARAAFAKLDDETLLARLARSGASKVTRRLAEEKLSALAAAREEPKRRASLDRELEGLVAAAGELASARDWAAAGGRLASLRLAWDKLDPERAHPRWPAFLAAAGRFEERREQELRRQEEESRRAGIGSQQKSAAEEVVAAVEALAGSLDEDSERRFREAEGRWAALDRESVPAELAERFDRACGKYREDREAKAEERRRFEGLAEGLDRAEAQLGAEDFEGARAALGELERRLREENFRSVDPSGLRTRLSAARKVCEERLAARAEAEGLARREALCTELEGLVEAEDRAAAGRRAREVQRAWRELAALPWAKTRNLEERFRAAEERFASRQEAYEQQQDWLRWNNKTLKEGLCAEAEGLDAEEDLGAVADKVKELQRRWKEVGPVPKADAKTLWERFKTACDRSFERSRPYLEELERRQAETVERKVGLCVQAEAHVDSASWKESAEALKGLQAQWKEAGPLPRKREEELYARFRQACNRFFERRQAHFAELDEQRRRSQAEKERLCERAEALAAEPERGHTKEFRRLQAEWKTLGPAPREVEKALWERFRGACDRFFSWLDEGRLENLRRKEALCGEVEALLTAALPGGGRGGAAAAVAELQERWRDIGPVPLDQAEALWDRFRASCDAVLSAGSGQPASPEPAEGGGGVDAGGEAPDSAAASEPVGEAEGAAGQRSAE